MPTLNVTISYDQADQEGRLEIKPMASFTLPNGEQVELVYQLGVVHQDKKCDGSMFCTYTLQYGDKSFPIGYCPSGKVNGHESIIFEEIWKDIRRDVKRELARYGYTASIRKNGSFSHLLVSY